MGVKEVKVGLEPDAFIAEPPEYSINRPPGFSTGTSITPGRMRFQAGNGIYEYPQQAFECGMH